MKPGDIPEWLEAATEDIEACTNCGGQQFELRGEVRAFVTTDARGTVTDYDIESGLQGRSVTAVCLDCHEPVH